MSDDSGWMVFDGVKQFGPHSREEIASFQSAGGLGPDAQVWREGMKSWIPASRLADQAPAPISYQTVRPAPRAGPLTYRRRVGRRSFIFQIWLAAWTVSYFVWVLSLMASAGAHSPSGPRPSYGSPYPSPQPSMSSAMVADAMTGISSSWMCLIVGWGLAGLPLGIAAVATLESGDHRG